ncbi:MAG: hypothetical protein D6813_08705 [Calditrichaeota bacterium]|nr:MAG: hypothetical protein D6813_08705 [Calditrichota bacterium]
MVSTIPLDDIEKYAENIYEAIVIMALRARQVNDEQKQLILREREQYDDFNLLDEEQTEKKPERTFTKFPKPTAVALEEFLSGKLKYKYQEDTEE